MQATLSVLAVVFPPLPSGVEPIEPLMPGTDAAGLKAAEWAGLKTQLIFALLRVIATGQDCAASTGCPLEVVGTA